MVVAGAALALVASGCGDRPSCGVARGPAAAATALGLRRMRESVTALGVLGLRWARDARQSDVLFLGYPDQGLVPVAAATAPWTGDGTGLHHTYGEDFDDDAATCGGDLRHALDGHPSPLTAAALAADFDALLALTRPADVFTHVEFDGHPDHAEVYRQLAAALRRGRWSVVLHGTLVHPAGTGGCLALSAEQWPNPADAGDPFARFTPAADVTPPPVPPCDRTAVETAWGPRGAPDELLEVPAAMQDPIPDRNLKWRALASYASQVDCAPRPDGHHHASCGYMRAFVKRHEFFWTERFGDPAARDESGPVLVVGAHPDDETLAAAGVMVNARAAGRRVYAAVVTTGSGQPAR